MSKRKPFKKAKSKNLHVWQTWDIIPFGCYKGKTLKTVLEVNPSYLEWWQRKKKLTFSPSLKESISYYKNIGK